MSTAIALAPARKFVTPIWPGQKAGNAQERFKWDRGDTLPIADHRCLMCYGLGLRGGRLDATQPCNCALRTIYRVLMDRYHFLVVKTEGGRFSRCTLASLGKGKAGRGHWSWGFPDHEFVADLEMLAKRVLTPFELEVFRLHELQGFDWNDCCRALKIDKGNFFHAVYRSQHKIGRAAREMQPYPLYPLDIYFGEQSPTNKAAQPTPVRNLDTLSAASARFRNSRAA